MLRGEKTKGKRKVKEKHNCQERNQLQTRGTKRKEGNLKVMQLCLWLFFLFAIIYLLFVSVLCP